VLPSAESVAKGYEQQRVALAVIVLKRSRSRLLEIDQRRTRRSPPQSAGFTNQGARRTAAAALAGLLLLVPGRAGREPPLRGWGDEAATRAGEHARPGYA